METCYSSPFVPAPGEASSGEFPDKRKDRTTAIKVSNALLFKGHAGRDATTAYLLEAGLAEELVNNVLSRRKWRADDLL